MSEKTSMKPLLPNMPKVAVKHIVSQEEFTKQYEYLKSEHREYLRSMNMNKSADKQDREEDIPEDPAPASITEK